MLFTVHTLIPYTFMLHYVIFNSYISVYDNYIEYYGKYMVMQ